MKTYNDLSDDQLIELHRLANINSVITPATYKVRRLGEALVNVVQGSESGSAACATHFQNETGDIWCTGVKVSSLWRFVALCQSWGVDYSPKES